MFCLVSFEPITEPWSKLESFSRCVNSEGSYSCQCRGQNRVYDETTKRCRPTSNVVKPSVAKPNADRKCDEKPDRCSPHGNCKNVNNEMGFGCDCFEGFAEKIGNESEPTCLDVDECAGAANGGCQHHCKNLVSFLLKFVLCLVYDTLFKELLQEKNCRLLRDSNKRYNGPLLIKPQPARPVLYYYEQRVQESLL